MLNKGFSKGWPKGTRVRMTGNVIEPLKGKEGTVFAEKYFDEEMDCDSYHVFQNGQKWHIPADFLTFVKYPNYLVNWSEHKVNLLLSFKQEIFEELIAEKQFGHFPNYGDNDEQRSTNRD